MAIQTSQILPQEDSETKTKNVYDQYDKLHSVVYYDKNNKVEKVVKVKVDPVGRIKENKTLKQIKVDVLEEADPGLTSITFKGSILDPGTVPVLETGFLYWRDINDPGFSIGGDTVSNFYEQGTFVTGSFQKAATGLVKNTRYYYRAFAKNEYGTNYSKIYTVDTLNDPDLVIAGTTTGVTPFAISLSANDASETPLSYAWNLTGGNTPQFTTRVANFTYNIAGTYTANLTGFYGGGVTAIRSAVITVNQGNVVLADWAPVQAAAFYGNTIAAYDMRNRVDNSLSNNLLAFWKLDDLTDSSGNGNTLVNTNNVQFVEGKIGGCAEFNGSNRLDRNALSTSIASNADRTFSIWCYRNSTSNNDNLFGSASNATGFFNIWFNGVILNVDNGQAPDFSLDTSSYVPAQTWVHVVVVMENNVIKVYIDSVLRGSASRTVSYGVISQLSVGNFNNNQIANRGKLDAAGIWNRALTEEEIELLYNEGSGTEDVSSTINAIVGPNLQSVNTTLSAGVGTNFTGDGSYLFSNATIPVTFPHTLVFVGRINVSGAANETVVIASQPSKWNQTSNQNVMIFGRPSQLNAYNGSDNQHMGYVPNGSEWFYVAASFLANNTVRYQIRSRTQNRNGTLAGNASKQNFNGFVGFGAGLNSATAYGYVGTVRLGMFINQEFTTESAMTTLFQTITAGPANGLLV